MPCSTMVWLAGVAGLVAWVFGSIVCLHGQFPRFPCVIANLCDSAAKQLFLHGVQTMAKHKLNVEEWKILRSF